MTKNYIKKHPGEYPVYSAKTTDQGVLGKINKYDYDGEYVSWTTNGYAGTVFYRNGKFNANPDCGLLKIKTKTILTKYLSYILTIKTKKHINRSMIYSKLGINKMRKIQIPVPTLAKQKYIAGILDKFYALTNNLKIGLPAEIKARQKQYAYYRNKLLTFEENEQ